MDAVCAVRLRHRGAGGHGTTDLLTEEKTPDDHDLGGKRTWTLQLTITEETGCRHSCRMALLYQ